MRYTFYIRMAVVLMAAGLLGAPGATQAQNSSFLWAYSPKDSSSLGLTYDNLLALDKHGNRYLAGYGIGKVDFDTSAGRDYAPVTWYYMFVAKYDSLGAFQFVRYIYSYDYWAGSNDIKAITVDSLQNIYIVGELMDTVTDFDPGPGTYYLSPYGDADMFVAKYDSAGSLVYAYHVGGVAMDVRPVAADMDRNGNLYIVGVYTGNVDFDPGPGVNLHNGNDRPFVAKYTASGQLGFAGDFGGLGNYVRDIAVDEWSSSLLVTGYFYWSSDFDPGPGQVYSTSAGLQDIYVARYSMTGTYMNHMTTGGSAEDQSEQVCADASGNIYISGTFYGTCDFMPGAGSSTLTTFGSADMFIAAYNSGFNLIYKNKAGSSQLDEPPVMDVDPAGFVCIGGFIDATTAFDQSGGFSYTPVGTRDMFFARYSPTGFPMYVKLLGNVASANDEIIHDVVVGPDGTSHVSGIFRRSLDFDPGPGQHIAPDQETISPFIGSYRADGSFKGVCHPDAASFINYSGFMAELGYALEHDRFGHLYIAGTSTQPLDFDPGPGEDWCGADRDIPDIGSGYRPSAFLASYSDAGVYRWALELNADHFGGDIYPYDVATDIWGNVYITGKYRDTIDFDPGPGQHILTPQGNGTYDVFVAKYDSTGSLVNAISLGNTSDQIGMDIEVDSTGGFFIAGKTNLILDFDPGPGVYYAVGSVAGQNIAYLARYNSNFQVVYALYTGTGDITDIGGLDIDGSGNAYLYGSFSSGTTDFYPGPGLFVLSNLQGNQSRFIAKFDPAGQLVYARNFNGGNSDLQSYDDPMTVDSDGNLYVAGYFTTFADFDPGPDSVFLAPNGSFHCFFAKYDTVGYLEYVKGISCQNPNNLSRFKVHGIQVDGSGLVYICGEFAGTADFDPGPGVFNLTSELRTMTEYSTDIFVAVYSSQGDLIYAYSLGGREHESAYDLAITQDHKLAFTGYINEYTIDMDPGAGNYVIQGEQDKNVIIAVYNSCISGTVPVVTGALTVCPGGTTTLQAQGFGVLQWYDAAAGGNLLATGTQFTFTATQDTTLIFVQDSACTAGPSRAQIMVVVVADTVAPTPDIPALPVVQAQCTVTVTAPTATDNCAGLITGTTSDPLTYNAQGTHLVHWQYTDSYGNTTQQTQTVVIQDTVAPVPLQPALPTLMGTCTLMVSPIPQAQDNCGGVIAATTSSPLFYDVPGSYTITWSYDDGHGNATQQQQQIVLNPCIGVIEWDNISWMVYPNPGDGRASIVWDGILPDGGHLLLVDMLGRVVYEGAWNSSPFALDISFLPPAIYSLMLQNADGHILGRTYYVKAE